MFYFFERIVFAGIIALLIFSPLIFGAVHPYAYTAIEIIAVILLSLWLLNNIITRPKYPYKVVKFYQKPGENRLIYSFILSFLAIIFVQIIPMPLPVLKILSPSTYNTYKLAIENLSGLFTLSLYPHATYLNFIKLISYFIIFWLTLKIVREKKRIRVIALFIISLGFFEALYGLLKHLAGNKYIWGFSKLWGLEFMTGTYLNKNHLAGYLEIAISLAFGYIVYMTLEGRSHKKEKEIRRIRDIFIHFDQTDPNRFKRYLMIFIFVILFVTLILTASRGGIISIAIALIIMNLLLCIKYRRVVWIFLSLAISCLIIIYGTYIGLDRTLKSFQNIEVSFWIRNEISHASLELINEYPLFGTGLGTFEEVFRKVQCSLYNTVIDHAHNDWIELWVETGLIGLLLVISSFLMILISSIKKWQRSEDSYRVGMGIGGIGALISLGLHSFTDFNMHIPANALTLAVVLAITINVLSPKRRKVKQRNRSVHSGHTNFQKNPDEIQGENSNPQKPAIKDPQIENSAGQGLFSCKEPHSLEYKRDISRRENNISPFSRALCAIFLTLLLIISVNIILRPYLADRLVLIYPNIINAQKRKEIRHDPVEFLKRILKAISLDRFRAEYFYGLSQTLLKLNNTGDYEQVIKVLYENQRLLNQLNVSFEQPKGENLVTIWENNRDKIVEASLKKAIKLNPVNPFYHFSLALHYIRLFVKNPESEPDLLTNAEQYFERVTLFFPNSHELLFKIGAYWNWKSKFADNVTSKDMAYKKSLTYFNKLLSLDTSYKRRVERILGSL